MDGIWELTEFEEGYRYFIRLKGDSPWPEVRLQAGKIDRIRWEQIPDKKTLLRYQAVQKHIVSRVVSPKGELIELAPVTPEEPVVEEVVVENPSVEKKEVGLKKKLKADLIDLAVQEGFEKSTVTILKKAEIITLLEEKGYV